MPRYALGFLSPCAIASHEYNYSNMELFAVSSQWELLLRLTIAVLLGVLDLVTEVSSATGSSLGSSLEQDGYRLTAKLKPSAPATFFQVVDKYFISSSISGISGEETHQRTGNPS